MQLHITHDLHGGYIAFDLYLRPVVKTNESYQRACRNYLFARTRDYFKQCPNVKINNMVETLYEDRIRHIVYIQIEVPDHPQLKLLESLTTIHDDQPKQKELLQYLDDIH